jgi:hypothetical protein
MIDPNQFDETLRQLIKADRFVPFYVELDDGQKIWIKQPALVIGDGHASLIDPDDGALVGISHKDVIGFHRAAQEVKV